MAMASVSAPMAQVFTFPKAKKRGRKVAKGPKAEVHVLYELAETRPAVRHDDSLEGNVERMARLIADRAERKKREWAEMLAANPNITEFPKEWRYRTLQEVEEHRQESMGETSMSDALADRIAIRAKELMGGGDAA